MTTAISSTVSFLTALSDTARVVESCEKMFRAQDRGGDTWLEQASVANRLISLGFTIASVGMVISGQKSEALATLKQLESIPRALDLPITLTLEITEADGSLRSIVGIFEKGIIGPMAAIYRVTAESRSYEEHHFLQMTPEQLKTAERPIYKIENFGETTTVELVGYRPVDIEECKTSLEVFKKGAMSAALTRTFAENGIAQIAVCDIGVPLYESLMNFFRPNGNPIPVAHPDLGAAALELDFRQYPRIPNPLYNDDVFRRFICPITQEPIRDPVRDPTNNRTLYERSAILNWLMLHHNSPITRQPLEPGQLIDAPALKAIIDRRLNHHHQGLINYLAQHGQDLVPAADQAVIDQNL